SQPVLFVFSAGNEGNGDDTSDPGSGTPDSITSPATAKNVITVGAVQEDRNIMATVTNADGSSGMPFQPETSTDYRVAGFSSRGNVGIGIEGTFGRYKPDVCAPGTFVISTRSEQWDINSYFYENPTNDQIQFFSGYTVQPGLKVVRPFPTVPSNAVQLVIETFPNANSPFSFAILPTLIGLFGTPGYQFLSTNDPVLIPPDPNAPTIQQILNSGQGFTGAFNFAISNDTPNQVIFDLLTDIVTTNGTGDFFQVLSNLDQSIGTLNSASTGPGPYYRFESGTSMATPAVSGTLALMQEFYAVAFGTNPSPAMLKAMLINGAQATGLYTYQVQNTLNYEGWGLVNLPGSLPPGTTNQLNMACSTFIQDQSPTNALATGDSQTWMVATTNAQPLRVTLAWTDPPGDPAAAIKLVNNLALIVTNLSNPTNPIVYYGNDIGSSTVNNVHHTNDTPVIDTIDNVQNVYLPLNAGTNFSVTVLGYRVNVNAVTAQTNNVVQDYALVISCGNGSVTNAMTVTAGPPTIPVYPPTDQLVSVLTGTNVNAPLLDQLVGANTPLLGANTVVFSTTAPEGFGPNNWQVTVGMTNQWHFYVVTNTTRFSNAAFVTFNPNAPDPDTLSIPRTGVFTPPVGNATREADIDLYVTTDSGLTNLDPNAISNCVMGTQIGADPGPKFAGASLGRGTTEFVVDTNSQSRTPDVYYIGVKSEDQEAAEYGFISIFSATPFSQMQNGNQIVNGVPVPVSIPDGSPKVPGKGFVFGLALYPMQVGTVTVSNQITHENFGDLIGTLTLNGGHADVLNNHDSFGSPPNTYNLLYDDSAGGGVPSSRPSDGPGSLINYMGRQAIGVWQLTEVDDSLTQTGSVDNYTLTIQPHQDLKGLATFTVPAGSWFYDFVDVPPGATNLTVTATTTPPLANPPLELFIKFGSEPTTNSFDRMALINNPGPGGTAWGSVSIGPPLVSGRYFVGIFNPSSSPASGFIFATVGGSEQAQTIYNSTDTPIPILDDAVTADFINVPDFQTISSLDVAIAVQHPRISDLVFHLISPDGTRVLLMENRGATDPNGAGGITSVTTNNALVGSFEGLADDYGVGQTVGGWTVTGNQVSVQNDPANAYPGTSNYLALANGTLSTTLTTVPGATYTLTFAYRGPNAVGWWRGESNVNDAIYGNIGVAVNAGYTNGIVGEAFANDPENYPFGTHNEFDVPDSPAYEITNSLSIEGWIRPRGNGYDIFWRGDNRPGFDPYFLGMQNNTTLGFFIENAAGTPASVLTTLPAYNQWYHVAATLDGNSGNMNLYVNGALVAQANTTIRPFGPLIPTDHPGIGIGNVNDGGNNFPYWGDIDEISLYSRALSLSEVQAIYNDGISGNVQGGNGKFDPTRFPLSAPQSLAEAQINLNGVTTNLFGNNTAWQTYTVSFKATQTSTPLQIQGLEPGMLLDAASVTSVQTNYSYLVFTENTNLTATPIKFAAPPFLPSTPLTNVAASSFDSVTPGNYTTTFNDGANVWNVLGNQVSVVADPANADAGSTNFLALANGTVSSTLPTVAGRTYILTFRYRGPGIAGWWRGESNTVDSAYGDNASNVQSITYTNGKVDSAFSFDGAGSIITAPATANLTITNLTFEGWVYPTDSGTPRPIMEYGTSGASVPVDLWVNT
ncbi:MAG: LamG-like jellyroll fold domain-containing protein, partial [Limisphaerales bacterium]